MLSRKTGVGAQVIPIDEKGQLHEASNIRIDELNVLDMKFLEATLKPTLVVLYQDSKEARHVKTYEVNLKDKVRSSVLGLTSATACCQGAMHKSSKGLRGLSG